MINEELLNYNPQYMQTPMPQDINPFSGTMQTMMQAPGNKPDILSFMREYNDQNKEKFNPYWFHRNDDDIIRGMEQVILSCQRDKYFLLKVTGFEVIKDYREIQNTLRDYYSKKAKNGKKVDNPYDYIDLRDSDIMLLKVKYYIKINVPEDRIHIDPKTGLPDQTEGEIEALIELPRYVNKYYFKIQGNYYTPVFQVVDGSTYNNATSSNAKTQSITLKTQFMPIKMYKEYVDNVDIISGEIKRSVLFTSYAFKKKTDACKFLLGRYGIIGTLEFLELESILFQNIIMCRKDNRIDMDKVREKALNPNIYYNFIDAEGKVLLSVPKLLYDRDNVTTSFCNTILKSLKRLENYNDIWNPRYWNKVLGADFQSATLDKGIPVLDSLESIYDLRTKESIRLPDEDKEDSYCILRWMMREFGYLRKKDNLDISIKRPRGADEYLPAIYAVRISKGIYRISDKGKNVTFKDVAKVVDTAPNYILKNINSTNLIDYVDLVNDNDAELALAYTYKGISGLGDQGSGTAVPTIYRSVHPSHLGRVDLDASSASDPGLSGIICPMAKVYGDSFSDYMEPNGWKEFYTEALKELHEMEGIKQAIEIQKKMGVPNSYDYVKEDMVKETIATYRKYLGDIVDIDTNNEQILDSIISKKEVIAEGDPIDGVGEIYTTK